MDYSIFAPVFDTLKTSFAWDAGIFVHLATLGYVLGFLCKNQILLRMLMLVATTSYIVYYFYFPEIPLWGAIIGSSLLIIANIVGTTRLIFDRFPFSINTEHRAIFENLKGLQPGEFRRLMKVAEVQTADSDIILTKEGMHPDYLYFVIEGQPKASKGQSSFPMEAKKFVGEVSFILNYPASATVSLPKGSSYARWDRTELSKILAKNPSLGQAFEALIGRDTAHKVAISEPQPSSFTQATEVMA